MWLPKDTTYHFFTLKLKDLGELKPLLNAQILLYVVSEINKFKVLMKFHISTFCFHIRKKLKL